MGLEFANSLDVAISNLKSKDCDRLIIDLRGNIGGGLGFVPPQLEMERAFSR
jgi:C-terminal processing protease CtpA/Prc